MIFYLTLTFMVGIKYNSLADLNGQALAWCNKVNGKVHATTNEIPFERLRKEGLSPLKREYIIDRINLRRVQKFRHYMTSGNLNVAGSDVLGGPRQRGKTRGFVQKRQNKPPDSLLCFLAVITPAENPAG